MCYYNNSRLLCSVEEIYLVLMEDYLNECKFGDKILMKGVSWLMNEVLDMDKYMDIDEFMNVLWDVELIIFFGKV